MTTHIRRGSRAARAIAALAMVLGVPACTQQICYAHDECLRAEVCNFETRECEPTVCGDGVTRGDEECDDGNLRSHDGCSSGCTMEKPSWQVLPLALIARSNHAVAYDEARDVIVLFGGRTDHVEALDDTWELSGDAWRLVEPASQPPGRVDHRMVYLPSSGRIVLFGGMGDRGGLLGDTWTFDGDTWEELRLGTAPQARANHGMTYDPVQGRVLLFGG